MARRLGVCIAIAALSTATALAGEPAAAPPPVVQEPITGLPLVHVPGGCFQMGDLFGEGDEEETPVHEVCLGAFYLGQYEVTRRQWSAVMGSDPSRDRGCTEADCPVDSVSWGDVQAFLVRLNARGGPAYRLPTEAEWEYAARSGGRRERYAGGDDIDRFAWYAENSGRRNHPVGTKAPNGLGLHDMSGNVWEWTNDWFGHHYYAHSPRDSPTGPPGPTGPTVDRVIRGGCKTGEALSERTSHRSYGYQRTSSDRGDKIGFRILRAR